MDNTSDNLKHFDSDPEFRSISCTKYINDVLFYGSRLPSDGRSLCGVLLSSNSFTLHCFIGPPSYQYYIVIIIVIVYRPSCPAHHRWTRVTDVGRHVGSMKNNVRVQRAEKCLVKKHKRTWRNRHTRYWIRKKTQPPGSNIWNFYWVRLCFWKHQLYSAG